MPVEITPERYQPPRHGLFLLYGTVLFLFMLFVLRFWYLQILHGEAHAFDANRNRTHQARVDATRGIIFDLYGRILAENRPSYCLAVVREDCPDIPATLAQVSQWTGTPLGPLQEKYEQERSRVTAFQPQLLVTDIPFERVIIIEQQLANWPGLSIVTRQRRFYPEGDLFAHILGYVAEANLKELKADDALAVGDMVGKSGLELIKEKELRGSKGLTWVEVDAHSRHLKQEQIRPSQAGANLTLSLDIDLQKAAAQALGEHTGCVVVMEPDSGKIRALVTLPGYDNNIFTGKLSQEDWQALLNDPRHPLQNRVIQSVYPPGSVWKLMMAGLILEQGISPSATVTCTGSVKLGNHTFRCWRRGGHGQVNLLQSLVHSCDVYYYEMSQKVGVDNIARYARASGFGAVTGIDLPHEMAGLVPSREWKMRRFGQPWQGGETLNISIGQGFTLVTPLQMAVFTSALLNGGKIYKPSLIEDEEPELRGELPMPASHRDFIVEGMRTTAESGTARRVARPDAVMGGKTGTAQVVRLGERRLKTHETAYQHRDHAWITTWGKKDGKTYVVVVMVEHGGGGSSTAGPAAAAVYDALFGPPEKKAPSATTPAGARAGRGA